MKNRFFLGLGVIIISLMSFSFPNQVSANQVETISCLDEISGAEQLLVCVELDCRKILNYDTAVAMLRDGSLTISKLSTGIYKVVYPGGLLIVDLEDGNI